MEASEEGTDVREKGFEVQRRDEEKEERGEQNPPPLTSSPFA